MFEKVIQSYKDLEVRVSDNAGDDLLALLEHTVHGAEGGMQYSLQNTGEKIKAYGDSIRFVSLYKKNNLIGTIGSCYRISGLGSLKFPSSYLKYLSFQAGYQATPGRRLRNKIQNTQERDESFKQRTLEIFSKPYLLELPQVFEGDKHLMYAFIESMNERTKNLVNQAGYEYVRSFLTVAFSRFYPKNDPMVRKIKEEEKATVVSLLDKSYSGYSLYSPDYSFKGDKYYVLAEGDEIIAGVAAYPAVHKIYHIPGIWGWVMMKILPGMPYYRRLFHPGEFRFLVLDFIYCREGREKDLERLLESVCATEGYNTCLTWLDDRSVLYDRIRTGINLGALNRMLNAKPGLVFIRFINFTDKEKEPFYLAPSYVSGFDFS